MKKNEQYVSSFEKKFQKLGASLECEILKTVKILSEQCKPDFFINRIEIHQCSYSLFGEPVKCYDLESPNITKFESLDNAMDWCIASEEYEWAVDCDKIDEMCKLDEFINWIADHQYITIEEIIFDNN